LQSKDDFNIIFRKFKLNDPMLFLARGDVSKDATCGTSEVAK